MSMSESTKGRGSVPWDDTSGTVGEPVTRIVGEPVTRKETLDVDERIMERAEYQRRPERMCRWTNDGHSIQTECGNAERSIGRWNWCPYCGGKIVTEVVSGSNYVAGLEAEISRLKHEVEDAQAYIASHDQALERAKADIARLEAALAETIWLIHNNPLDGPDSVGWVERHELWISTPAAQRGKEVMARLRNVEIGRDEFCEEAAMQRDRAEQAEAERDALRATNESFNEQRQAEEITRLEAALGDAETDRNMWKAQAIEVSNELANLADLPMEPRPGWIHCVAAIKENRNTLKALNESLNAQNVSLAEENVKLRKDAHNERVEDQTLTAPVSFPSPPEPNQIASPPDPVSPIRDKNILPTGKALWIKNGSGRVGAAQHQLATVEAVCRWIEYPPRVMAAGTMVSILRADAQARVDEARKEAKG